jgi:UPF0176 protein
MEIIVLAYYVIEDIADPHKVIKEHKKFLETVDSKGRIYIGYEGVNAQLSIAKKDLDKYLSYLKMDPLYDSADFKGHEDSEHRFAKLTVKFREQIVALKEKVNFKNRGEHISPKEWNKQLNKRDENTIIIDVRNNYESEIGYFEGALKPDVTTFKEFINFADNLSKMEGKENKTILMYCTGGIRCEFYSPVLKERGFENVKQLKGGVIGYGLDQGKKHWRGKLFVFDDRLAVPISPDNTEIISKCKHCGDLTDLFYNCANMDCNKLFLCCKKCAEQFKGCCNDSCMCAHRLRTMDLKGQRPTPFRKLTAEQKSKYKEIN